MPYDTSVSVGARLAELRRRSGLSLDEVAKRAGYRGRSSVQQFFSSDYDPAVLDGRVAMRLAGALKGEGAPAIESSEIFALAGFPEPNRREWKSFSSQLDRLPRDVPVYLATDGDFDTKSLRRELLPYNPDIIDFTSLVYEENEPIQFAWRPPNSRRERDHGFYGLIVASHACEPRIKFAEMIIVDEKRNPRPGDEVVVTTHEYEDNGGSFSSVLIGTFKARSRTGISIHWPFTGGQINAGQPLTGDIVLPAESVRHLDRILTMEEIMGQV